MNRELPPSVTGRTAVVYVRQSTGVQVKENLESQRRQYALADVAREYGFRDVRVIDDDLGVSASGTIDRPGFRSLVCQMCEGVVASPIAVNIASVRPWGARLNAQLARPWLWVPPRGAPLGGPIGSAYRS